MKTINFKCPKCGHEWTKSFADGFAVSSMQRCPSCLRYSEDAIKVDTIWTKLSQESGKKATIEKKD